MVEVWRKVKYSDRYEVSNLGNIRSYVNFHSKVEPQPHAVKPQKINCGYLIVTLYKDKTHKKCFLLHRLIAETFIPNPNNYRCVNHKDENKLNNNVDNLEWCTHKYNNNYNNKGKRISASLINNPLISKPVYQLDRDGQIINEYPSVSEAARVIGCADSEIDSVCLKKQYRRFAHGYGWKFKE